jgi:hypothetical protein
VLKDTLSSGYSHRTEQNIIDSDVTLIFATTPLTGGSLQTANYAKKHNRPFLVVNMSEKENYQQHITNIIDWLGRLSDERAIKDVIVLNVAGSRESKCSCISSTVRSIVSKLIRTLNGNILT